MHMLKRAKQLLGRNYRSLNRIEVSGSRLIKNYRYLNSLDPSLGVAPVVKSNAYGHGISLLTKTLDSLNAPFLCVDSLFEAYELAKAGVKTRILIMGFVHPESLKTKRLPFSFAVVDREQVDALARFQPHAPVHLFLDTGMHREGVALEGLNDLASYALRKNLEIEGLMSHFAMAEKPGTSLTKNQLVAFRRAQQLLRAVADPKWIHIANSSGLLNHQKLGKGLGNLARVGIAFYGYARHRIGSRLRPALELKTTLAHVKRLKKGDRSGYDFTFTAKRSLSVGILPIGYNDGVDRRLSGTGVVTIGGRQCPIIGRVNMNITSVDISVVKAPSPGKSVNVFSRNPKHKNSLRNAAAACGTIAHDLLVHLHPSTKRVLVK